MTGIGAAALSGVGGILLGLALVAIAYLRRQVRDCHHYVDGLPVGRPATGHLEIGTTVVHPTRGIGTVGAEQLPGFVGVEWRSGDRDGFDGYTWVDPDELTVLTEADLDRIEEIVRRASTD